MTIQTPLARSSLNRRNFLVSSTAAAGAFSLGFSFPFASASAAEVQELNCWVVIQPDDKVVIRIARSEMGQGTLTGLAQLVAEELECDWSEVTTEGISPARNLASKRAWGGTFSVRQTCVRVRTGPFIGSTPHGMAMIFARGTPSRPRRPGARPFPAPRARSAPRRG